MEKKDLTRKFYPGEESRIFPKKRVPFRVLYISPPRSCMRSSLLAFHNILNFVKLL